MLLLLLDLILSLILLIFLFSSVQTGTVKFFNESKGFGFITNDETGKDIFVHVTGLKNGEVREGNRVNYEEEEGRKGKVATQVVVVE